MNPNSETTYGRISMIFPNFQRTSNLPSDKKLVFSPSLPSSLKPEESGTPYLFTIINVGSFLGFFPFQVKCIKPSSSSSCRSSPAHRFIPLNPIRKLICFIVHLTAFVTIFYNNVRNIIFAGASHFSSNFTRTFDLVTNIGIFLLSVCFLRVVWRKQSQLLDIIQGASVKYSEDTKRKQQFIAILAIMSSYCLNIYFSLGSKLIDIPDAEARAELGTLEYIFCILKILFYFMYLHSNTIQYLSFTFILMLTLTLRQVKKKFCVDMDRSLESLDLDCGFEHYTNLKELSTTLTRTFGNMILFYYIITVAYFAKIPESSVWRNNVQMVAMISYFALASVIWLVSAEFHMNIRDTVQNWATHMQDLDDLTVDMRIRLLNVVNDNLLEPIGVSCKFFTISYGFLGSMLGLIVTYAIIVFQMQAKPYNPSTGTPSPFDVSTTSHMEDEL